MRLDRPRSGSILVLSAFLMLIMLGMVAFALDTRLYRGIVDIGPSGGKTPTLREQILHGLTPADLNYHGGKLELNDKGELVCSFGSA